MNKLTKKDLKGPDIFHESTANLADWGARHSKSLLISVVMLAVVGLMWTAWGMYSENQESKAQAQLFKVQKAIKAAETDTKNLSEEKYKASLNDIKWLVENYGQTQAAALGALDYSRINYGFKKYDDNISLLEKFKGRGKSPVVKALIYDNLAVNYTAKGDCNKAIETWNQIEGRDEMAFMHGDVFISKALCYEKLGQNDKALEMYKRAEGLMKSPDIVKLAKKYSRLAK